jgi:hypothetical protein
MNDTELDELLNTWSAPPAPASLRENVRAGFAAGVERKTSAIRRHWIAAFVPGARKRLLAAAILGVGAFLLIVTQAFPQMFGLGVPPVKIPYTVDSEYIRFGDDGSWSTQLHRVQMYSTSYNVNGREIILSRSLPGNPFGTALRRALDPIHSILSSLSNLTLPFVVNAELLEKVRRGARVITGCGDEGCMTLAAEGFPRPAAGAAPVCVDGTVVGRETILNYPTVAVQLGSDDQRRLTLWMAPDLGCFALRITIEEKRPDGTFHLVSKKQALRVTLNP